MGERGRKRKRENHREGGETGVGHEWEKERKTTGRERRWKERQEWERVIGIGERERERDNERKI